MKSLSEKNRRPLRLVPEPGPGLWMLRRPDISPMEQLAKIRNNLRQRQSLESSAVAPEGPAFGSGEFDAYFEPKPLDGPPRELLRELTAREDRARDRAARRAKRVTLDMALYVAMQGPWRDLPSKRKLYEQAKAAIRILRRRGQFHVDAVTEDDLRAVINETLAEGLSVATCKFRLRCLSTLGVKARVWQHDAALKTLTTMGK